MHDHESRMRERPPIPGFVPSGRRHPPHIFYKPARPYHPITMIIIKIKIIFLHTDIYRARGYASRPSGFRLYPSDPLHVAFGMMLYPKSLPWRGLLGLRPYGLA